jgi:hypothetical protein
MYGNTRGYDERNINQKKLNERVYIMFGNKLQVSNIVRIVPNLGGYRW